MRAAVIVELLEPSVPYLAAVGSSAVMALLDKYLNGRTWDQVYEEIAVGSAAGIGMYRIVGKPVIERIVKYGKDAPSASKVIAKYYDFSFNWCANSMLAATSNLWLVSG